MQQTAELVAMHAPTDNRVMPLFVVARRDAMIVTVWPPMVANRRNRVRVHRGRRSLAGVVIPRTVARVSAVMVRRNAMLLVNFGDSVLAA